MEAFQLSKIKSWSWYISTKKNQGTLQDLYGPTAPALPLLLRHREIHGIRPVKSLLITKLNQLHQLMDTNSKKHAAEISNILLWVATHHPEVLDRSIESCKYGLSKVDLKCLYFPESWESLDELVPTNALTTLVNSGITWCLEAFCGYVTPQIVSHLSSDPLSIFGLGLSRHIDVASLIDILKRRRQSQLKDNGDDTDFEDEVIAIHLRCGEVDLKDLASLPGKNPLVYISNVSDHNAAWVVQATTALQPKSDDCTQFNWRESPYIDCLYLHRSKLTAAGVEEIAKGLSEAGINIGVLSVSSPYLDDGSEIPGYESLEDFRFDVAESYGVDEVKFFTEEGLDQYGESIMAYISDDVYSDIPSLSDDSRDGIPSLSDDSMDDDMARLLDDSNDDIASLSEDSNDIASLSDDLNDR